MQVGVVFTKWAKLQALQSFSRKLKNELILGWWINHRGQMMIKDIGNSSEVFLICACTMTVVEYLSVWTWWMSLKWVRQTFMKIFIKILLSRKTTPKAVKPWLLCDIKPLTEELCKLALILELQFLPARWTVASRNQCNNWSS